ncbi:WPE palindromic element domain-containing protein [Wolbachia endosymbiont of Cantharis cryptica]|uniref:WPE palindromic element domain-containing protein n=1 Tax=Wolbachia endosymbiont of Cantharis cryptica TaxID=3066132 RepID=UPI00376F1939
MPFFLFSKFLKISKRDIIPVLDPENLTLNEYTKWLNNENWIPASRAGMTTKGSVWALPYRGLKSQCSYSLSMIPFVV